MAAQQTQQTVSETARKRILGRYLSRTARSAALHREAKDVLPGGIGRNILCYSPYPAFIREARGAYLYDLDENRYVDLVNNYTAVILGHNPPEVADELRRVPAGVCWAAPNPWEVEFAEALCRRIPSVEQVRFTNSGTEATMFALRVARAAKGRSLVAKFEGGYHGMHDYVLPSVAPALVDAGVAESPRTVAGPGIPAEVAGTVLILPFNDLENTERLIRNHADLLAAVIVEPVQGVAGILPPAHGFLRLLRDLTHELGIILIFDEVITLRLAVGGAQEHFGVIPDMTTFGKVIGGGFAIGAFGGKREIMGLTDPFGPNYRVSHSGTFSAAPATMAAGLVSLRLLTAERLEGLNRMGDGFRTQLEQVLDKSGLAATVTGVGSLLNVHFTRGPVRCYREAAAGNREVIQWLHLALLNEGVALAPRGMMALTLAHTDADLVHVLASFAAAASALQE